MLVSGGQILAIDKVNTGNTILGDGVQKPLDVNTDLIATTSSVSSVSSVLEQQIDSVSSNFQNYYKKTETSGADEISAAFENFKTNQTIVSAGSPNVTVDVIPSGDKTIVYRVNVQEGEINIAGASGVSAKYDDGTWTIGLSANFLSANALEDYYKKSETSAANEISAEFAKTSAWADETFLKEHQSLDDYYKKSETSGADEISNALLLKQDVSAMSAYATSAWVDENYQKKGNYVTSAGDELAGKQLVLKDNEWQELEETNWTDKIAAASAAAVTSAKNYTDTKLEDYYKQNETSSREELENEFAKYQIKGDYLSANALDDISGKWESVYDTVYTASGSWNEASAFAANSAKFVTSAGVDFNPDLAYFLKKQEESVVWSGVDLSDLGKMYNISSITPDLISAGISADAQNNPIYVLSAAAPEQVATPDISGYGLSAWKDTEDNKYFVSANIVGNHGVSAAYDNETNTWQLGISANDYSFLFGHYSNNAVLTDGTVLKLDSNNYHGIDIDDDGYITLPETVNKFTFCINEYIDDNTIQAHSYLLNKLVLSAKGNDQIVASQNYYPSEVGASNVTLALTIDATTAPNREYCIVYKGSDVATNKLHIEASILEEVTSLDSTGGAAQDYTGQNPIRVVDNSKVIQLLYDSNVFSLKRDEQLQADILTIEGAGGETVDKEAFDKLLHSINGRLTETIPFGALDTMADFVSGKQYTYLFRPTIEYELSNKTVARMFGGNGEAAHVSVALYDVNDADRSDGTLLWNSLETVRGTASELILSADPNAPTGNTISPDHTYRVSVRITNEDWHNVLGTHIYGTIDTSIGNPAPWQGEGNKNNHNWPNTFLQSTPGSMDKFGSNKPYVSFRTEE